MSEQKEKLIAELKNQISWAEEDLFEMKERLYNMCDEDQFEKDVEQGIISPYEAQRMREGKYRKPK